METISKTAMLAGAAALALSLGACEKYENKSGASADPGAVKSAIKADEAKWNEQFKSKDTEGVVSHYADDAYFAGPGMKPADGSTAIRQVYANASTDPAFNVQFASDKIDVAASGDMAYSRGHFTEHYTDSKTHKVMANSGYFLTVWKKQSDGSWKAVEDFTVSDPGSAKPVEPGKPATGAR